MLTPQLKIKIRLWEKGISGAEIGRRAGVSRAAICRAIKGELKSKKLRNAICETTGLPKTIWSDTKQRKAA